jgi:PKHD-type hydroxylase|tara:strand:- start:1776 stop:2414 length:639 start_codon:yes stop_codon:yes gene_type:complete
MNLSNYYWYFPSAVPHRICDDIIKHGLTKTEEMARTGGYSNKKLTKDQVKDMKKKRNSDVVWLNDTWIYKELHPYIHDANKNAGWNFEWDRSESCQFTKYKHNQYYDWHYDSWHKPYERDEKNDLDNGKIRKLSMTCQLTDGSEYEGGELEFDFRDYAPHMREEDKHLKQAKEILPKGSIIVFPSFVWHRVKPVTKGTRYSLVMWNLGYPFK